MKTCPTCHEPMPELNSEGQSRTYCGRVCAMTGKGKPKVRDIYAEEVEHLLSFGTPVPSICASIGASATALARALYREQRPDLANPFERYSRKMRGGHTPERRAQNAANMRRYRAQGKTA